MPSVVPAPLARVAELLRCPSCSGSLASAEGALRCAAGHTHNVARHGHVTLVPSGRRPASGDDAAMVAARVTVLDEGHFSPITAAVVNTALSATTGDAPVVVDIGAGTGHHLAVVLEALPGARGVALDASRAALRRAARAHPRIAAVIGDVWRQVPLGDATVDIALNVFAPRNPAEIARVLRPGGMLVVVTPSAEHLRELVALHGVRIDPHKGERLDRQFAGLLPQVDRQRVAWRLRLAPDEVAAVVRMGPAAHHLTPPVELRLGALAEPLTVTAAVDVHVFQRLRL